jgi:hypothetical protein
VYEGSFFPASSPTPVVGGVANDGYSRPYLENTQYKKGLAE